MKMALQTCESHHWVNVKTSGKSKKQSAQARAVGEKRRQENIVIQYVV